MTLAIGYLAFALNVAGNLLLVHKRWQGWAVRIVTNVAWIAYAAQIDDGGPVVANHAAFMAINLYGLSKWGKKKSLKGRELL